MKSNKNNNQALQEDNPRHVAIIMDGNGRWAKTKGMTRPFGHKNALKAVGEALEGAADLNIPYLTLFAFSTENWKRPKTEINILFKILVENLKKECEKLVKEGIRLETIGEIDSLPKKVASQLNKVKEATKDNSRIIVTLALNYGSKYEILRAAKKISQLTKEGKVQPEDIDEKLFEEHLYTKDIPAVDLMIRTSGEYRISNFLLWQMAYAELYFCDTLWPDFRKKDFFEAIKTFKSRDRRFGKIKELALDD